MTSKVEVRYFMDQLTVEDRIKLLNLSDSSPVGQYAIGVKHLFGGEIDKAKSMLAKVADHDDYGEGATFYMKTWDEVGASKLLTAARKEFKAENWAKAKELLEELKSKYQGTDVYRRNSSGGDKGADAAVN